MLADNDFNLPQLKVELESLRTQLEAFQTRLTEIESVIPGLSKYCPGELKSFLLIRNLVKVKIEQLEHKIKILEEDATSTSHRHN